MIKNWIKQRSWLQLGILLVLAAAISVMWPLCLVRDEVDNRTGDMGHCMTEEMQVGMNFTQTFRAKKNLLGSIDYVFTFDPTLPLEGKFLVEILDEEGRDVYSREYPFNLTPDYSFCSLEVNQRLKKGAVYQLRVTNLDVTQNLPRVVYTEDPGMFADNNGEMTFNGEEIAGQALTRYTWKIPMDWRKILCYSGFMGLFAFVAFEVEEMRLAWKKGRKAGKVRTKIK